MSVLKTPFHIVQVELGPGIVDNRGMALAQLCSPFSDVLHEASHLFVASPDLLAACKAQEDYDRYLAQCGDCPTLATCREVKRRRDYARALCEAAIARAKGDLRE